VGSHHISEPPQARIHETSSDGPSQAAQSALKRWVGRLVGIFAGLLMAWLLLEVMLRLLFFSLPPRVQLVLDEVRVTPFSDRKMLPDPIWQPDRDYLTIARPVRDRVQYGNAEVRFTVTTETLWGSRAAFRTQQAQVDRYVDAVAVGDSFTFCFTDADDCWVQRLGELTGRNIINLGIVSTGSQSHGRVLHDFGLPLKPSLVIWQWFGNDANEDYGLAVLRGETALESPVESPSVPNPGWWDTHSAVYAILKLYLGAGDEYDAALQFHAPDYAERGDVKLAFGQSYLWGAFDMSLAHNQYGWQQTQAALRDAHAQVASYGGTLLVLLMPPKELVYRDMAEPLLGAEKMAILDRNYAMMLDLCAERGWTCFDPLPVFRDHAAEQLYYTTDMHLNARGNTVLAEALAGWLNDHPEVFTSGPAAE